MTPSSHPRRRAAPAAPCFDLLAALYLREPDDAMLAALATALPDGEAVDPSDSGALRQEYYDLFVVPVSGRYLPPYESAQRDNRLWGPLTHRVTELYTVTGFDPTALTVSPVWRAQRIPDHIGYELAFFSALLHSRSSRASDAEAADQLIDYFWEQHLLSWVPAYGRQLLERARTPLYRRLGALTVELCALETAPAT